MRKFLLLFLLLISTLSLQAKKDGFFFGANADKIPQNASEIKVSIYPVPVKKNSFTIKSSMSISSVKITNIIGQDIFRTQFKNPQTITEIFLNNNQKRGMYLVTITFSNGMKVVKKIMIEEEE